MNHKAFFKRHGKTILTKALKTITIDLLYEAFKSRLLDETNLQACNCEEQKKVVLHPGGWVCPAHGNKTVF